LGQSRAGLLSRAGARHWRRLTGRSDRYSRRVAPTPPRRTQGVTFSPATGRRARQRWDLGWKGQTTRCWSGLYRPNPRQNRTRSRSYGHTMFAKRRPMKTCRQPIAPPRRPMRGQRRRAEANGALARLATPTRELSVTASLVEPLTTYGLRAVVVGSVAIRGLEIHLTSARRS